MLLLLQSTTPSLPNVYLLSIYNIRLPLNTLQRSDCHTDSIIKLHCKDATRPPLATQINSNLLMITLHARSCLVRRVLVRDLQCMICHNMNVLQSIIQIKSVIKCVIYLVDRLVSLLSFSIICVWSSPLIPHQDTHIHIQQTLPSLIYSDQPHTMCCSPIPHLSPYVIYSISVRYPSLTLSSYSD